MAASRGVLPRANLLLAPQIGSPVVVLLMLAAWVGETAAASGAGGLELGWATLPKVLGMPEAKARHVREQLGTLDALLALTTDDAKALGMNVGQRNRLRVLKQSHKHMSSSEPVGAKGSDATNKKKNTKKKKAKPPKSKKKAAAMQEVEPQVGADGYPSTENWRRSTRVREFEASDPEVPEILAGRNRYSEPIVLRGAMLPNKEVMSWGDLASVAKTQGPTFKFPMVKVSEHPNIIYWKQDVIWLNRFTREMRENGEGTVRTWHRWKYVDVEPSKFLPYFNKTGAPYLYWLQKLPDDVPVGFTRPQICEQFVPWSKRCMGKGSPGVSVWGNSVGVLAQAHYDMEGVIFMQLAGLKRFTFWHPADIDKLCMHPYIYPANGQSQIDMDVGGTQQGKIPCRFPRQHNRSVTLAPGDVMLLPSYFVHRVEAVTATVSMAYNFQTEESVGQDTMLTAAIKVLERLCKMKSAHKAQTTMRVLLRRVIERVLGSEALVRYRGEHTPIGAFLQEHWHDWEMLPDREELGFASEEEVAQLCTDEKSLTPKTLERIDKTARKIADVAISSYRLDYLSQGLKYLMGNFFVMLGGMVVNNQRPLIPAHKTHTWYTALHKCAAEPGIDKDEI